MKGIHYTMLVLGALIAPIHQLSTEIPAWAQMLNAAAGMLSLALTVLGIVSQSALASAPIAAPAAPQVASAPPAVKA